LQAGIDKRRKPKQAPAPSPAPAQRLIIPRLP
jgi:hypothetical protein